MRKIQLYKETIERVQIFSGVIKTPCFGLLIYNYQKFLLKTTVLKEYKSFNIEEIVYLFYFYNPKRSIGKYFFLIVDCYLKFLQKYNREVFCTKGDFEGMLLNLFSKNLSLRNVISGTQYQLRLCKVEDLKNKQIAEIGYKNKEISQQIESIQIFIKPNI